MFIDDNGIANKGNENDIYNYINIFNESKYKLRENFCKKL